MHRLKLFGGASIEGPAGPLGGAIAQRQRLAFLAVLCTASTGLVSRDKLLALLWPDLDSGRARRALSNALYVVKKELGEDAVSSVGDDLRLDAGVVSVDVLDFEGAVESGDLEGAESLYAGPFLEGVHVKEAPEFEKWADGERDRLAGLYSDVLEKLAQKATRQGRQTDAAEWWRKLAVHDPYSTRIALGFMEASAAAGDRAGALRYAQIHTILLREEFGADPDPALTELADRFRRETPQPSPDESPEAAASLSPDGVIPPTAFQRPGPGPEAPNLPEAALPPGPRGVVDGIVNRLGKQRLFQWGLAYLAGAWFILQALDVVSQTWAIGQGFQQIAFILLFFGFFLTLVLVWYHGEEGRQRVSGPELLIISVLLVIAGGVLSIMRPSSGGPQAAGLSSPTETSEDRPTIAVLPFENLSPNPADAYFADGMQEEILSKLAQISSLKVLSRSSVMQFREERPSVREMAAQLGADFFLEGSARIAGGLVRLTTQLIDATSDGHLWSAQYDQPLVLDSLMAVQSLIADSVAFKLEATLTPREREQIQESPTENLEAYELYLQGRFLWNQRTEPEMRRALGVLNEAIALDSSYAPAYAGLADVYLTLLSWDFAPYDEAIAGAEGALQRALSLNPLMGEARTALGSVLESRGDVAGAGVEFRRALELAPDYATGHHWYALFLARRGYFDDALTHIRYAESLDPLSRMITANAGWIQFLKGDYPAAISYLEALTQVEPEFAHGWSLLGLAYGEAGRFEDGIAALDQSFELEPWPNVILSLARLHALAGNEEYARAVIEDVHPRHDPVREAQVFVALGEVDRALELLEDGIRANSPNLLPLYVEPQWDPIRDDPRFQEIMRRLGFPG